MKNFFIILALMFPAIATLGKEKNIYQYRILENAKVKAQCHHHGQQMTSQMEFTWASPEEEIVELGYRVNLCLKLFPIKKEGHLVLPALLLDNEQRMNLAIGETWTLEANTEGEHKYGEITVRREENREVEIQGRKVALSHFKVSWKGQGNSRGTSEPIHFSFLNPNDFHFLFGGENDTLPLYSFTLKERRPLIGPITLEGVLAHTGQP